METLSVEAVEPVTVGEDSEMRGLSDPLGTTAVGLNRYRLAPDEALPAGLHAHVDQEEVFVVLEGILTFETLVPTGGEREAGEVTVEAGTAIRFAPGEFQSGRNSADGETVAYALGAPRETEDVRIPLACPECAHDDLQLNFGGDDLTLVCPDCSAEQVPQGCPRCAHELRATLGDGNQVVVACTDCGAEFEEPPFADE